MTNADNPSDPACVRLPRGEIACEAPDCPEAAQHLLVLHLANRRLRLCPAHWERELRVLAL
jgi:hypothetical protein